jgi:hypothetical protein
MQEPDNATLMKTLKDFGEREIRLVGGERNSYQKLKLVSISGRNQASRLSWKSRPFSRAARMKHHRGSFSGSLCL